VKIYFTILFLIIGSLFFTTFFDSEREKVLESVKMEGPTKFKGPNEVTNDRKIKISDIKNMHTKSKKQGQSYERLNELIEGSDKKITYTDIQVQERRKAEQFFGIKFSPGYAESMNLTNPSKLIHHCPDHLIKD